MSENEPRTFDEAYVKQLRDEAAGYRTKAKDLESELGTYKHLEGEINQLRVENELTRRGLNIETHFIGYDGKGKASEAVDQFLVKYPQFATQPVSQPQSPDIPNSLPPAAGKANIPIKTIADRSWDELKEDPVARETVGRLYRNLLPFSNQPKDL